MVVLGGQAASQANAALAVPKGPREEQRPADGIERAVTVARVATGEIDDTRLRYPAKRRGGLAGAKARAEPVTAGKRRDIASKASKAGWN